MSIYSTADTGLKVYRSRMNLSHRKIFDADYGYLYPVLAKFVLPGDIWKMGANVFARYQPTLAPILTRSNIRMRYFFVPLRLVEPNTEKVITGSENGKEIKTALPTFPDIFDNIDTTYGYSVEKWSWLDYMGIPVGVNCNTVKGEASAMAHYWYKAYLRIWFDYYRDENLSGVSDFDTFLTYRRTPHLKNNSSLCAVNLRKDYFTSSLPFQLKGPTPTFQIGPWTLDFGNAVSSSTVYQTPAAVVGVEGGSTATAKLTANNASPAVSYNEFLLDALNKGNVSAEGSSFDMSDIRSMAAQTRLFERLARCGSRYTEYLNANFNISPSDGTLQRAQYLGGFKQPIVTTEIAQTGEDANTPVGTLRGKGISSGGNSVSTFRAKEFGVIFGLMDIMPDIQYTQGSPREYSYKSRFDFFNPSFQNLSEQEVRKGEIYYSADGQNDDTFGFVPMYNELRKSSDIVVGDMRDTLKYWTQSISFASRPNLVESFVDSKSYLNNFHEPFFVKSGANPIIIDCANVLDVYRPMTRYSTPGLIDHN